MPPAPRPSVPTALPNPLACEPDRLICPVCSQQLYGLTFFGGHLFYRHDAKVERRGVKERCGAHLHLQLAPRVDRDVALPQVEGEVRKEELDQVLVTAMKGADYQALITHMQKLRRDRSATAAGGTGQPSRETTDGARNDREPAAA